VRRPLIGLLALAGAACAPAEAPTAAGNGVCDPPSHSAALPEALEETSGVAASRRHAGVFWTHNDSGGDSAIFAFDSTGAVLARVRIPGVNNRDWEDIAVGPCEPGGPDCVFIAEIGDNRERHSRVAVFRIPEPDPATDTVSDEPVTFRFTYPEGPRDAEGLFVTDAGIHVVNKGRSDAIELFRLPPPYVADSIRSLVRVQRLAPPPTSVSAQVTAAAADPQGTRVVIRTYAGLRFFEVEGDTLRTLGRPADLIAPGQLQGEGVDFLDDQRLILTGEAQGSSPPSVALIVCDPTRPPPEGEDTSDSTPDSVPDA
jgi:hypothetical protein